MNYLKVDMDGVMDISSWLDVVLLAIDMHDYENNL